MLIKEKFEPICRLHDDTIISLGLFDSYGEAYDAAIIRAASQLPNETLKVFQINKVYVNIALEENKT